MIDIERMECGGKRNEWRENRFVNFLLAYKMNFGVIQ